MDAELVEPAVVEGGSGPGGDDSELDGKIGVVWACSKYLLCSCSVCLFSKYLILSDRMAQVSSWSLIFLSSDEILALAALSSRLRSSFSIASAVV